MLTPSVIASTRLRLKVDMRLLIRVLCAGQEHNPKVTSAKHLLARFFFRPVRFSKVCNEIWTFILLLLFIFFLHGLVCLSTSCLIGGAIASFASNETNAISA